MGPTTLPIWSMPGAQLRSGLKARVGVDVTIVGIGRVGSGRTVERLPLIQRVTARQVRSVV